jgi:hypothetical protein
VGLLLFEMAKSKQKPFPLLSLILKMRFRFTRPAKLAVEFAILSWCAQVNSLSVWPLF